MNLDDESNKRPGVERLLELQRLLAAFNQVDRQVHRSHAGKIVPENDTEHSYNLAVTAWFLAQYFPELDESLLIKYSLVHDLVEIHAGDTYVYGTPDELASKAEREAKALVKLQKDWSDFPDMLSAAIAYENKSNNEARFVYALDKIMPVMLVYIHNGYSWKKNDVTVKMLYKQKSEKAGVSEEILPYFNQLLKLLLQHPEIIKKQ